EPLGVATIDHDRMLEVAFDELAAGDLDLGHVTLVQLLAERGIRHVDVVRPGRAQHLIEGYGQENDEEPEHEIPAQGSPAESIWRHAIGHIVSLLDSSEARGVAGSYQST